MTVPLTDLMILVRNCTSPTDSGIMWGGCTYGRILAANNLRAHAVDNYVYDSSAKMVGGKEYGPAVKERWTAVCKYAASGSRCKCAGIPQHACKGSDPLRIRCVNRLSWALGTSFLILVVPIAYGSEMDTVRPTLANFCECTADVLKCAHRW